MQSPVKLAGALLLAGCVYGVRGGPETAVYSRGAVITQAAVTGVSGFGSTTHHEYNSGVVETLTVGVGGDVRNGGPAVSVLGGLEWFRVPEEAPRRWGYRVGLEGGTRWRGPDAEAGEVIAQLRGAAVYRLTTRRETSDALLTLGLEATLGAAAPFGDTPTDGASFVTGIAVTVGAMHIGPFRF